MNASYRCGSRGAAAPLRDSSTVFFVGRGGDAVKSYSLQGRTDAHTELYFILADDIRGVVLEVGTCLTSNHLTIVPLKHSAFRNFYVLSFIASTTSSSALSFTIPSQLSLINLFDQHKPFLDLRFLILEWNKNPSFMCLTVHENTGPPNNHSSFKIFFFLFGHSLLCSKS